MKIALIGYGKMGKMIEELAKARNHTIVVVDLNDDINILSAEKPDVAIEFTTPEAAPDNISACLRMGIPVVSGTTGWLDRKPALDELCRQNNGAFFYASNYSLGVNIFFRLNAFLARTMSGRPEYQADINEIHHTQKKDSPSGTAITLAEELIANNPDYSSWSMTTRGTGIIPISAERIDPYPGTHRVRYRSRIDDLEITHTAHSREGFAAGALAVAEWMPGRKGVLGMSDFLPF